MPPRSLSQPEAVAPTKLKTFWDEAIRNFAFVYTSPAVL
jgi:hypothetical protein